MITPRFNPDDLHDKSSIQDVNSDQETSARPIYSFINPDHDDIIIKVVGVGGGGSHAVKNMQKAGIRGVDFMVVNTDRQALRNNPVQKKIQIGTTLTGGLGAGSNAEVGEKAAQESRQEIIDALSDGTRMVFITAGMGGGTGTGASPIIAEVARELGILTVGIVTLPFSTEGVPKMERAFKGVAALKEYCDTVLVILNDKLVEVFGSLSYLDAYQKADSVLLTAAKSIAEIITVEGHPNVDFNDVKTVMQDSRTSVMGTGIASGENACRTAAAQALDSPLLNNYNIAGAKFILVGIFFGKVSPNIAEIDQVNSDIQEQTGFNSELKFSAFQDPDLEDEIRVTVIATGFEDDDPFYGYSRPSEMSGNARERVVRETAKTVHLSPNKAPAAPSQQAAAPQQQQTYQQPQSPQQTNNASRPLFTKDEHERAASYQQQQQQAPKQSPQTPRTTVNLDGTLMLNGFSVPAEDPTDKIFAEQSLSDNRLDALVEQRKARQERQRQLNDLKRQGVNGVASPEGIKMMNEPTWLRMNIDLNDNVNPGSRQVSRTTVNMDNELRENNRFLHDNID